MRVTIVLAILIFSLGLVPCSSVYAQSGSTNSASQSASLLLQNLNLNQAGAVDLGQSNLSPISPFYFLKAVKEKIEITLAKTRPQMVSKELEFSIRRLKETNSLIAKQRSDLIAPTLQHYQFNLDQATGAAGKDPYLNKQVGMESSRHLDVLERDYDQVGDPGAKTAIRAAIEKIIRSNRQIIKDLGLVGSQEFIKQVTLSQALGCKFLQREAGSGDLNGTVRQYLNQEVASCVQDINSILNGQLQQLNQPK